MSSLQSDLAVSNGAITGTLHEVTSGALARDWGPGYFMALGFEDNDDGAATIYAGMNPSQGSGLLPLDEDMDGVFKVTDKDSQTFRTLTTDGLCNTRVTDYDLSGLTLD